MKSMILIAVLSALVTQAQTPSAVIENQCRQEAKVVALKSYQACVSGKKAEQVETLRKEYQEKISQLKSEYDSKIKNLINKPETGAPTATKNADLYTEPTIVLKKAKSEKKSSPAKGKKAKTASSAVTLASEIQTTLQQAEVPSVQDELNEVTGSIESLEMVDPTVTQ